MTQGWRWRWLQGEKESCQKCRADTPRELQAGTSASMRIERRAGPCQHNLVRPSAAVEFAQRRHDSRQQAIKSGLLLIQLHVENKMCPCNSLTALPWAVECD